MVKVFKNVKKEKNVFRWTVFLRYVMIRKDLRKGERA